MKKRIKRILKTLDTSIRELSRYSSDTTKIHRAKRILSVVDRIYCAKSLHSNPAVTSFIKELQDFLFACPVRPIIVQNEELADLYKKSNSLEAMIIRYKANNDRVVQGVLQEAKQAQKRKREIKKATDRLIEEALETRNIAIRLSDCIQIAGVYLAQGYEKEQAIKLTKDLVIATAQMLDTIEIEEQTNA